MAAIIRDNVKECTPTGAGGWIIRTIKGARFAFPTWLTEGASVVCERGVWRAA